MLHTSDGLHHKSHRTDHTSAVIKRSRLAIFTVHTVTRRCAFVVLRCGSSGTMASKATVPVTIRQATEADVPAIKQIFIDGKLNLGICA